MKKVFSVVGARPNFMKVAPIHRSFARYSGTVQHEIVHTGQHYSPEMSDNFFADLEMASPAFYLNAGSGSHAQQTAKVIIGFEKICQEKCPDLVIVVGDVNSTLACAVTAVKCGIKVAHIEAGLRSFDRTMPEEINRIVTDAVADFAFVTETSGKDNLLKEGWDEKRIFFVGNTMIDSLHFALPKARQSNIVQSLKLEPKRYVVVTLHRPSNVDDPNQLEGLLKVFVDLAPRRDVVLPLHPRTQKNLTKFGLKYLISGSPSIHIIEPQSYIAFLALLLNADFVLTDSGGIQEETTALGIPCLTLRSTTERPVTCEMGTNRLVEPLPELVRDAIWTLLNGPRKEFQVPPLWDGRASGRIVEIILESCL
jgi:UDP-N-acetylglucosamine 2-epimerase (non-hydrolysing)